MTRLAYFAPLAIAAALLADPARADDGRAPVNFHFNRSELASEETAGALHARMMLRARKKCDPRGEFTERAREACAADLVGQWVAAIGDPRLEEIHALNG